MSATEMGPGGVCGEVEEQLSQVLDGTAPMALFDHIADCDACRDLRHEAARAAEAIAAAGADFRPPGDFVEALLGRLDAARPSTGASSGAVARAAPASGAVSPARSETSPLETARTELSPLTAAEREATAEVRGPVVEARQGAVVAPVSADAPSARVEAPAAPAVSATSHHAVDTAPVTREREAPRVSPTLPEAGAMPSPAPVKEAPARAVAAPKGGVVSIFRRRPLVAAAIAAAAAAAGVGFFLSKGRVDPQAPVAIESPWSGKIASVKRASSDQAGGLQACDTSGACAPLAEGAPIPLPTTLRTDARTRAHLALEDGTELAIDRGSTVWLGAGKDRAARVDEGTIVADVAKLDGAAPARIAVPQGQIEVLGTKLAITASADRASVEVARGVVRLSGERGEPVEVRAGEEATISRGAAPQVASATSLADVMEWSDRTAEEVDAPTLRGLGELRARKPGSAQEKERAVRLAKHAVKVRIVDVVARTEVDETFTNETDEELEGIFRFPLPPGAQIERLALEVDGKLIEGAFVDRDRGAAIWRGVLQNAAPKAPRPVEEIVWVPGPWRDPALLEWQRGGRFELKIFPIPRRGSRRVVLTYTQIVEQAGGVRRYTYPLAHDDAGTTRVGDFALDLQVLGHDKDFGVRARGYELAQAAGDGDGERRLLAAQGFTPAGDLTVEYALPDREREATAWAYRMSAPAEDPVAASQALAKAKTPEEKTALEAARAIVSDASPYVAIAVRPKLPRWQEAKERLHVLVVDASRSMVGERFSRATRLAASIVREMDRRDEVVVLACDTVCRAMDGAAGAAGAARPMAPGAAAAGEVERFLGGVEPDGGSDLAAAMIAARAAAGAAAGKELRILYLGDGTPSVGPTRAAHLEAAVRGALPGGDAAVIAVALGNDADTTSLQALARGGGGVMIPYVPGQRVSTAALEVLGAAYGLVLRDPEIELPAGLTQVSPSRLDPIRAGGEAFVVARMSSGSEVSGAIRVKGRVAGERFEQSYPVTIVARASAGNAFVPRLYAAAKIAELERAGGEAQKPTVIELSKRFAVASRFTSLLVLESEAMFKAFGLDRGAVGPAFTGEERADSVSADAEGEPAEDDAATGYAAALGGARAEAKAKGPLKLDAADEFEGFGSGAGRGGFAQAPGASPAPALPSPTATMAAPPPPAKPASRPSNPFCAPGDPLCRDDRAAPRDRWRPPPQPERRMVPMRKVFDRKAAFDTVNTVASQNASKLLAAEGLLASAPDSRDRTVGLYALYATSGRIGEAQELTARWSGRDALDPDALIARADLAARQGDRDRAVRILGGLADVRPGDRAIQARLADLHDAASQPAFACQHRLALADLAPSDAKLVVAAIQCARAQGMSELADQLRLDVASASESSKLSAALEKLLAAPPAAPSATPLRGDIQLTAAWTGGGDLDLSLIDEQGKRTSWLGSPSKAVTVSARDVTSPRAEALALQNLPKGNYVVEISRAAGGDAANEIARGELTLKLAGETRKIPFTLTGPRLELGAMRVFFTSRLVPIEGFGFGGRGWRD